MNKNDEEGSNLNREKYLYKEKDPISILKLNNEINSTEYSDYEYKLDMLNDSGKIVLSIRKDIENELGLNLFNRVYDIIDKSLNDKCQNFDMNHLSNLIKSNIKGNSGYENLFESAVNKIPDIYFLIIKDRERYN